jgi:predicted RND superfamily exporter protein
MKRITFALFSMTLLVLLNSSCKISLSGASTIGLKTINVEYFENNAPLVVNYLSQQFTESLKDRIRSTTSLSIVQGDADADMSGTITGFTIEPVSVQATNNNVAPVAGAQRLTVTVSVKYTNKVDKKLSFTQTFSKYQDFTGDEAPQEQKLITAINKQLTDDIFNRAFANW